MRLIEWTRGLLLGSLLVAAGSAAAQEFPTRVIRIVVGDAAGSGADIAMRLLAQKVSEAWNQQVIVDNRAGANGIIGAEVAAKSKPDGYTLLAGVPSMLAMNQFVYRKLPYNTLRDFDPVTQVATNYFALVVTPSLPAKSVGDLVKLAKSRPGEVLFGSAGIGNQNHLGVEMFASATGIKIVHVPHKGTAPALSALMGGEVVMMLTAAAPVAPHIAGGKIRLLATAAAKRPEAFSDVPTIVEAGYPDVVVIGWTGLLAPKGTPRDILTKLSAEFGRAIRSPDVQAKLGVRGSDLTPSTPDEFTAFIKSEIDKWSKVIRAVGLENSQ